MAHCTHRGVALDVSQRGAPERHPTSTPPPTTSSTHATQTGSSPDVSHNGFATVHPLSKPAPLLLSRHGRHSGADALPLQTPPVHRVPVGSGSWTHCPEEQRSMVQLFPSLQSAAVRQATQRGDAPDKSQRGAAALQPRSTSPAPESSMQMTQLGFELLPLHTPPEHEAPLAIGEWEHVPALHVSFVH